MKIYLHIGTHKTGTTAIQAFATANRALLLAHGLYWPEEQLKRYREQHSKLAFMIKDGEEAEAAAYIARALKAAKAKKAAALLLSGETFCQLNPAEIKTLTGMFGGHQLEVIIYFRNVYDYAASAFLEAIKGAETLPDMEGLVAATRNSLHYTGLIQRWENTVAAPEHLHIRCYDDEKADLVPGFFARLGVPETLTRPRQPKTVVSRNESIDLATQLMLAASGYVSDSRDYNQVAKLYAKSFAGRRFVPPSHKLLAESLCNEGAAKLLHLRLVPFRDRLRRKPPMPPALTPDEMIDYLERLSAFCLELAAFRKERKGAWAKVSNLGKRIGKKVVAKKEAGKKAPEDKKAPAVKAPEGKVSANKAPAKKVS